MFITTANTTDTIPRPLLDRMEVIELPSYTDEEKLQIAKRYLLPKEMKRHGLEKAQLKVSDGAIREMVASYTRESGVRVLERKLAAICRKAAMHLVSEDVKQIRITEKELKDYLGAPRYYPERQALEERVGVVNGLAWTSVGGELLEVEVNVVPGTGKVELTGNLGDVMKESAHAALSFIRSQADRLGIQGDFYQSKDIHVHFPEGAVPKDGPSAGIAITTAMVSALTGAPVRREIAMTGEVTLRGRVLPIGGLKEKTMAAYRSGRRSTRRSGRPCASCWWTRRSRCWPRPCAAWAAARRPGGRWTGSCPGRSPGGRPGCASEEGSVCPSTYRRRSSSSPPPPQRISGGTRCPRWPSRAAPMWESRQ